jgi:hypothetical protein
MARWRTVRAMTVSHGGGPLELRKARRIQIVADKAERKIVMRRAAVKTRHFLKTERPSLQRFSYWRE